MIVFTISLFLIVHSYIFYPAILYLLNRIKRTNSIDGNKVKNQPDVSIIISVFNEEKIIKQRIENLFLLDYPKEKIEILIGSDCSSDSTNSIVEEYKNKGITLIAFHDRRGKASVLNDLASTAKNEILVFSDANTFYDKDVLKKFTNNFNDRTIGGVCGYLQLRTSEDNSGGKGESFYWEYENRIKELEGNYYTTFGATGAIYAIRKSLFKPLPTHKAIMDDFLIPMKVVEQGFRIVYDKTVFGWEEATDSAMKEFQRKIRIGAANFNCLTDIIHLLNPKYGFVAIGLFSHKIIRWFVPFLLLIVFLTSFKLRDGSEIFQIIFNLQLIFVGLAVIGYFLDKLSFPVKIFTLPYYFLLANLGLMIGFYRFLRGSQKATWSVTR